MANEREIYDTAMRGYQAAMSQERSAYEQAQLSGDFQEAVRASQSLASLQAQANEYHRMAAQHVQSMQSVKQNPHGLSDAEMAVARNWTRGDPVTRDGRGALTEEQKIESYARNKEKLRASRQSGEYQDRAS